MEQKDCICIYCLRSKPISEFNREHVIQQCFGTFEPNNLILYDTVCAECNEFLGKTLDLPLATETLEGVVRDRYGVKPSKIPEKLKRVKFVVPDGEKKGMILTLKPSDEPGKTIIDAVAQVAFCKKDEQKYHYFEPQNIPSVDELRKKGYELGQGKISVIAKNQEEKEYLIEALKEKGIDFIEEGERPLPDSLRKKDKGFVRVISRIDRIIQRGFSKITFNYLSLPNVVGRNFALHKDFNGIRNFIRYDEGNSDDFFVSNQPPILYDESKYNIKITNGHLVIVQWKGMDLHSKVSIFNINTYLIKLCKDFQGIWRPIKCGHLFDVNARKIISLEAIPRELMI